MHEDTHFVYARKTDVEPPFHAWNYRVDCGQIHSAAPEIAVFPRVDALRIFGKKNDFPFSVIKMNVTRTAAGFRRFVPKTCQEFCKCFKIPILNAR